MTWTILGALKEQSKYQDLKKEVTSTWQGGAENVKENYKYWSQELNKFRVTTQFVVQTEILLRDKGGTVNIMPGQQAQTG